MVTRVWLNGRPVNERIIDVFPTPVSPSNSTLYVASFPPSPPGDDDTLGDDTLDDDDVDVDDDDARDALSTLDRFALSFFRSIAVY